MKMILEGRVFASLNPNTISIHIGFTQGMIDCGGLWEVERNKVPASCRMPNSLVWVTLVKAEIIAITAMKDEDQIRFR